MNKVLALVVALALAAPLYAGDAEADQLKDQIRQLQQKVTALENRLQDTQQATDRLAVTTQRLEAQTGQLQDISASMVDGFAQMKEAKKALEITGKVSVTAYMLDDSQDPSSRSGSFGPTSFASPAQRQDTNDIMLEEMRLNFDVTINPNVKAHIALSLEDDLTGSHAATGGDTDTSGGYAHVDQAYILIHDIANQGIYAIIGKQYFPTGNQNEYGNFIRDSQARRLYETRDTGLTLGWKGDAGPGEADVAAFIFNGQNEHIPFKTVAMDRVRENVLDTVGVAGSYTYKEEGSSVKVGGAWVNNLYQLNAPTDGYGWSPIPKFPTVTALGAGGAYEEAVPAYSLYAVGSMGDLWLSVEWVAALTNLGFGEGTTAAATDSKKPNALSAEVAYTFPVSDRDYTAAVRYEVLNDCEQITGIESVIGLALSTMIYANTKLTVEYDNYDLGDANVGASDAGDGNAELYQANVTVTF